MTNKKIEMMSFEEAYNELEQTLSAMEKSDVTLEESMKLFKRGVELYKRCKVLIDSASLSVKEILENIEKEINFDEDDMGR